MQSSVNKWRLSIFVLVLIPEFGQVMVLIVIERIDSGLNLVNGIFVR